MKSARNYEEVAEIAEAKLNSWDNFFEQKQAEFAEVQQQMGSVDIQTTDKVVSP